MNAPYRMSVPCVMLIGLPGTGKSECARLTAELLGWSFGDTDKWIESAYEGTVAELFSREGEPFFRSLESVILQRLASPTLDPDISERQLREKSTHESCQIPDHGIGFREKPPTGGGEIKSQQRVINRLIAVVEDAKQEAQTKGGVVLATGGGMPVPSHNQSLLQSLGRSFYLACDLEVLAERLLGDKSRPLLHVDGASSQKDATLVRLQELLNNRRSAYSIASEEIDTTTLTTARVAEKLKESILAKINM